jgi:hypothetical protein
MAASVSGSKLLTSSPVAGLTLAIGMRIGLSLSQKRLKNAKKRDLESTFFEHAVD